MNLAQLRYFVEVAETLSFTKAAARLGVSQPPLSQQIRRLETEIGGKLLTRTSRQVRLTDLGEALLTRARRILAQVEDTQRELGERVGLRRGRIRVGASGALASHLLPELLSDYQRSCPGVEVHVLERRTRALLEAIEECRLDVALIRWPHPRTELPAMQLTVESMIAVLPRTHPKAGAEWVRLGDLRNDPFVLLADMDEPFAHRVLELCAAEGFTPNIICAGAGFLTCSRLVGMGVGVSIISKMASKIVIQPEPSFVPLHCEGANSPVVLVTRPRNEWGPAATAFVELILNRFGLPHDLLASA